MATLHRLSKESRLLLQHLKRCRCQIDSARSMASRKPSQTFGKSEEKKVANKDGIGDPIDKSEEFEVFKEYFADADPAKRKNWTSSGWSAIDRTQDEFHHNISNFSLFTLFLVYICIFFWYIPDYKLRDWIYREAYLDLDRREKKGQPPIDPYFIPPEKVKLPSPEELKGKEIIL